MGISSTVNSFSTIKVSGQSNVVAAGGNQDLTFAAGSGMTITTDATTGTVTFASSATSISLTNTHILVGNASNIATDVAMSGDITIDNTGITTIKSSVALAGSPTTTTQLTNDNSTKIATTAWGTAAIAAALSSALIFKNAIDCSSNPNYPASTAGWVYVVSAAGKIGGASGANVEVNDTIYCITTNAGGTQAVVGTNFIIVQANIDGAVIGPASATDNAIARFDTTTGKLIQNSAATIADSTGDITAGKYNTVAISGSSTPTLSITGTTSVSGVNTGDQTSISGNAATATALATARAIGGVNFDGTAAIVPQTIQTVDDTSDTTGFLLFGNASGSVTSGQQPKTNTALAYNATTNNLQSTLFTGALVGNSSTSTTLATGRLIQGSSFDGSANISIGVAPTVQTFTSGSGTYNKNYTFIITSGSATVGATYTNNAITYTVYATVASATKVVMSGSGAPAASGTLTKASGTGDSTITFSQVLAPLYLKVRQAGGGGGGGGSGTASQTAGGTGGNTTFGSSLLTANGGVGGGVIGNSGGAGGSATVASPAVGTAQTGGSGTGHSYSNVVVSGSSLSGGCGGNNDFGGAGGGAVYGSAGLAGAANTGGGGGGGGTTTNVTNSYSGSGGGAGGFLQAIITSPSATYSYAVGAAGTAGGAGTSGFAGGAGGSGYIEVIEFYQ